VSFRVQGQAVKARPPKTFSIIRQSETPAAFYHLVQRTLYGQFLEIFARLGNVDGEPPEVHYRLLRFYHKFHVDEFRLESK
jgi:hypothetical protein